MPRKKRFEFDPSNTSDDGHYVVGKGRPPEAGKFKKGDGRKRGRRAKGTRNLASDLREELDRRITVLEGGVPRKVTRQRGIVMRLADNASKGSNTAIALTLDYQQRLVDPLLEREEQIWQAETNKDYSVLSFDELTVLHYITAKTEGIEDPNETIVGVLPVYRKGEYLSDRMLKEIEPSLRAYGIEIVSGALFPPQCKVI